MPAYRALAELRRVHAEGEWFLAGVVIGRIWYPAAEAVAPPSIRAIDARLVTVVTLAPVIASEDAAAVAVAVGVARDLGYPIWPEGGPADIAI